MRIKQEQTIKRYPRIAKALLAVAEDTDTAWAAGVIAAAKKYRKGLPTSLVREAFMKRHLYSSKAASRAVKEITREDEAA